MDSENGSGSNNHSRTNSEVVDGSGSSKHSKTNLGEVDDGSGSSKHSTTHLEAIVHEDGHPAPTKILISCSSASSSSSDASSEDFFEINKNEVNESRAGITISPKSNEDFPREKNDNEIDVSSNNSFLKLEEVDNRSNGPPSSQVSVITQESVIHNLSPTQSPPVQSMERSGEYNPYRIPSSVFARSKSTTQMEWSVASNESLFSIHVGNNSFSGDHIFMLGGDMRKSGELFMKSGELTKSGELFIKSGELTRFMKSGEQTKSGELIMFSPPPPAKIVGSPDKKNVDEEKNLGAVRMAADESIKDDTNTIADDLCDEKTPPEVSWNSSSISHHSDESGTSTRSFAFPVKKKCAWPFCYCSNCSWAFCYSCTWPSCYCSNCSRASCYCWNRSRKRLCCFSSTVLTEGVRSSSVNTDAEHQQLQTQTTKVTSNVTTNKWFPCFSWCHHCYCC